MANQPRWDLTTLTKSAAYSRWSANGLRFTWAINSPLIKTTMCGQLSAALLLIKRTCLWLLCFFYFQRRIAGS